VRLRSILFQQQQGLKLKARERLLALIAQSSNLRLAQEALADLFENEGWLEDQLKLERENLDRFPPTSMNLFEHAKTLLRDRRRSEARVQLEALQSRLPGHLDSVRKLADLALEEGELGTAERWTLWRLRVWPTDLGAWSALAEIYRRMGQHASADEALRHALYL